MYMEMQNRINRLEKITNLFINRFWNDLSEKEKQEIKELVKVSEVKNE